MGNLYKHSEHNELSGFKHPVIVTENDIHIDIYDAKNLVKLMQIPSNVEWVRENLSDPTEPPYWRIHVGDEIIGIHIGMYLEFYRDSKSGDVLSDHIDSMLMWFQYGSIPGVGGVSTPGRPDMPPMKRRKKH